MNQRTEPLTYTEVKTVYRKSKKHAQNLNKKTKDVYRNNLDKCGDPEQAERITAEAFSIWRRNREEKLHRTLDTGRYKAGIKSKDPYFLTAFKPIAPIFYNMFLERGIPASEVDQNDYDILTIRRLVKDDYREEYSEWQEKFNKRKSMYYADFNTDIQEKLGVNFGEVEWQLKKGELTQILRLMQKAATKQDADDIPHFKGEINY